MLRALTSIVIPGTVGAPSRAPEIEEERVDTGASKSSGPLLKIPQVQEELQVGRTTIYRLIGTGELAVVRIGRSVRIPRKALDAWLRSHLAEAD
jgi:excisionase family DNA binding protein